jgi:hypothetical protein
MYSIVKSKRLIARRIVITIIPIAFGGFDVIKIKVKSLPTPAA